MRDGSLNGSPRRNRSSIRLKIVVFSPMPSASVRIATKVKAGDLRSWRTANFRSFMSFGAQSVHWIDARSSPRRNHAGAQRHKAKKGDAGGEAG